MKRSTHTDAKRQDMQPVRAGLTAGSVAAMVGVLANLPLHSPSDAFFKQRHGYAVRAASGPGAGLLWRALSHRRRRTIYFAAATALVFGLISIAAIAGESQMERSVSYMVPLAAIVLGLTGGLTALLLKTTWTPPWKLTILTMVVAIGLGSALAGHGDQESGRLELPPQERAVDNFRISPIVGIAQE